MTVRVHMIHKDRIGGTDFTLSGESMPKLGDVIACEINGRPVTARVANVRPSKVLGTTLIKQLDAVEI